MADSNHIDHKTCSCIPSSISTHQTLNEMDWERGIWNAAHIGDIERIKIIIHKSNYPSSVVNALDNAGYTALHYAARNGHINVCKILLENGAHVDAQTKSGCATPLHRAATTGHLDIMNLLLENKACPEKQDIDGYTILHRAAEQKHENIMNFIMTTYPHLQNIKDNKGRTALNF